MGNGWGWPWFAAWTLVGGLLVFSVLAGFSIGLFILPFALVAAWAVARGSRPWPASLGLVSGAGLVCLGIALANRGYQPCPDGLIVLRPGEEYYSCGGFDPVPWLVAGIVLVLAGVLAHAAARRTARGSG